MKKSLYLFAFITLTIQSFSAYANEPLNRNIVNSFVSFSDKMDTLDKKYPEILKKSDEFKMSEKDQLISYLKSSKAYPDIKNILSSTGFDSLKDLFDISDRIIGSMYSVQMQKTPQAMDINKMKQMLELDIKAMKKNGVPAELITQTENSLKEQIAAMQEMISASKKASSEDKKFARQNIEWLMSRFPDEDHNDGGH